MPPDEAGAKAGEYPCAGRGPAAVAGGTPPPKARESDDGADAGGVAIRGAGRTGPGKRREKRARGAGRSILREGRGKGRDSVAKYGEKVSEGGGTSVPAGEKGSGGGA